MIKIGELSRRTGASADALRLYERKGLITAARQANGYRVYPLAMVQIVQLIQRGQCLGFSLAEMKNLVGLVLSDTAPAEEVATALDLKINEIDARIRALNDLRTELGALRSKVCPLRAGDTPS